MAATVSGAVLSSLFFGQSNCLGDQEGVLFGQVIKHVKDTISDSQINNYQVETKIYIYSCYDCTGHDCFHDNRCRINESFFKDLKEDRSELIGWYHFRRNASPRISMKETCIHKNLLRNLPPERRENFLFFHCTVSQSGNMATHSFDYGLYKWSEVVNKFLKVPVTVVNLGDTTHTAYRHEKSCTVSPTCGAFSDIVSRYQPELLDQSGKSKEIHHVAGLAHSLHSKLQDLTRLVAQSEQRLLAVEGEVEEKRETLKVKLENKRRNQPLPPSPPPAYSDVSRVEEHPKAKVPNEDAISLAKSKREQRRREGTKSLYPNLSTCLLTGRPATTKSRSESTHHSRRLSGDTDYMETVDLGDLNSSSEFTKHDSISESCDMPSDSSDKTDKDSKDLLDLADVKLNQIQDKNEISLGKKDVVEIESDTSCSPDETNSHSKSNKKGQESSVKNSDPFSFVSELIKDKKQNPTKSERNKNKFDSMTVPQGGSVHLLENASKKDHGTDIKFIDDFEDDVPQRKTRSQTSQKPEQKENVRGQRSQNKQEQNQRSRSKESKYRIDVNDSADVIEADNLKKSGVKNSAQSNSGKMCRQQVTVEVQGQVINNTNSMHDTDEFVGDVEMTNLTENEFEISSSPVF